MRNAWKNLTVIVGVAVLSLSAVLAQESGQLVDVLVEEGVITSKQAEDIRARLAEKNAQTTDQKIQLSSFIKALTIYGDVRYRYEVDDERADTTTYNSTGTVRSQGIAVERDRDRNRVRLRLGTEWAFTDSLKANVRIATGAGGNSSNADLGNVQTGGPGNAGAFSSYTPGSNNSGYALKLDIASLEYDKAFGADWLTLIGGKQLFGHNLVQGVTWDDDTNPEGGFVKFGDFKAGDFTISSTHGAYIYGDITEQQFGNQSAGASNGIPDGGDDTWLLINQVNFTYKFDKEVTARLSPGFINYVGTRLAAQSATSSNLPATGNIAAGTGAIGFSYDVRDLNVFVLNLQLDHPLLWDWKQRIYGDYGYNISGVDRAKAISGDPSITGGVTAASATVPGTTVGNDKAHDQFAVVGLTQTRGKGKGAISFDEQFVYQEADSWDPNLTDSDWFGGANLNGVGFSLKTSYNFTDNVIASLRWRHANAIDDHLPYSTTIGYSAATSNSGIAGTAVQDRTDLVQADLTWKF